MLDKNEKQLLAKLFGHAVQALRETQGLRRADLAKRMQVQHTRIVQIENGKVDPQVSTVLAFAEALAVTPSVLLEGMTEDWRAIGGDESEEKQPEYRHNRLSDLP